MTLAFCRRFIRYSFLSIPLSLYFPILISIWNPLPVELFNARSFCAIFKLSWVLRRFYFDWILCAPINLDSESLFSEMITLVSLNLTRIQIVTSNYSATVKTFSTISTQYRSNQVTNYKRWTKRFIPWFCIIGYQWIFYPNFKKMELIMNVWGISF